MTFVGVDGGATHMRLLVLTGGDRLVAADGPGVSPEFFGEKATAREVARLARSAGADPTLPATAALCLAGVDTKAELLAVQSALESALPAWRLSVFNDMAASLTAGAPEDGPAVVVSAGTGANAGGRTKDGAFVSLRAKGYVQGNFGGGYDITKEALHAAFRSEERTGAHTSLEAAILELTGLADYDALSERLSAGENYLLSLVGRVPPLVTAHAEAGDAVAKAILARIGGTLAELGAGAAAKAGIAPAERFPLVLAGGVALSGSRIIEGAFREGAQRLMPKAEVRLLKRPPVRGALLLAVRAGGEADEDVWALCLDGAAGSP